MLWQNVTAWIQAHLSIDCNVKKELGNNFVLGEGIHGGSIVIVLC